MRSLIVPVNFSTCSSCAADYAADFAMAIEAEIHLINVVTTPMTSGEIVMTEYVYEAMNDSANTCMEELRAELEIRTHYNVPIHTSVTTGGVYGQVEELCKKIDPYAIVLGTSRPTLEKTLAGSPVGSLLHLPCPVLVIPEKKSFHRFRHIVMACAVEDLETGLPHSLPFLRELRRRFHADVDIVTIRTGTTFAGEKNHLQSEAWKTDLRDLDPRMHFLHHKDVEEGLFNYLFNHPADLVIVFPKKHFPLEFHSSLSKKIAKHSTIPVMSLHE